MQPIRRNRQRHETGAQFQRASEAVSIGVGVEACAELQSLGPNSVAKIKPRPTMRIQK
jgi:hypothetical protein